MEPGSHRLYVRSHRQVRDKDHIGKNRVVQTPSKHSNVTFFQGVGGWGGMNKASCMANGDQEAERGKCWCSVHFLLPYFLFGFQ